MRDFLLNEELFDRQAADYINRSGESCGLLPVYWVHYNERIKIEYFPDGLRTLAERVQNMSLDQTCSICKKILARVVALQEVEAVSLENITWDTDSIYTDSAGQIFLICLPALVPPNSRHSEIYAKRLYVMIEDLISVKEDNGFVCRQISYQKQRNFGDWKGLMSTLDLREMDEEDHAVLTLRSINTPRPCVFTVRQTNFRIGSDPGEADGAIEDADSVDPVHAVIGWNGINYFVVDTGSEQGTFVNDHRIEPHTEIPIGEGTVLRFGEYTFNVE